MGVRDQYEKWPYPRIPLLAKVHREQLWQINAQWMQTTCGQEPAQKAKIWIAGCGTFQPYAFSRANPSGEILATDLSRHSLEIARRRCRFHGIKNVTFRQMDLMEESSLPEGPFDLIECYGVLMCLPDPARALRNLAQRLKPNGVLRLMVYPHYGRQRIFQIQRIAKLLGLHHSQEEAPAALKRLMQQLPKDHPLRYAFFSYHDSRNDEGIVDGFLHASDRGFTGIELCDLIDRAGLDLAACVHRPWGQPREMGERLGLAMHDTAFLLHYLDLWQELRSNFILCAVPKGRPTREERRVKHPLFDLKGDSLGMRHRLRLLRLAATGTTLESRTDESRRRISSREVRGLMKGETSPLKERSKSLGPSFSGTTRDIAPFRFAPLAEGPVNPVYEHLFEAFVFDRWWNGSLAHPLPSLSEQVRRWEGVARPLEDSDHPMGLTPFGTYRVSPEAIDAAVEVIRPGAGLSYDSLRLENEGKCIDEMGRFLGRSWREWYRAQNLAVLRELWVLLFSHRELFLKIN